MFLVSNNNRFLILCLAVLISCLGGCGFHLDKSVEQLLPIYTNAASRFVEIDGVRVHYRDEGVGSVVILLHGSNSALQTWEGWVQELKQDFRLISLDLPGHGLTGPHPDNHYQWKEVAQFVDQFTQKIGLSHFAIAGNSMGGAIAWHYALYYPQKVDKLILIDSRGIPSEEPLPFTFWAYSIPGINNLLTVFTPRWMVAQSIKDVYGDASKVTDALVDRYFDLTLREGNREATKYRMTHLSSYDELSGLTRLRVPTLIMWGQEDRWILPKYAQRFATLIPGAKLTLYPGLGHTPMEEAPHETAAEAKLFLTQP